MIKQKLADSRASSATDADQGAALGLPDALADPGAERRGGARRRSTAGTIETGEFLDGYPKLKDDGSTVCGCWIYCGVFKDGVNQAARARSRTGSRATSRPSGRGRGRRTGGSSTTAPPPTPTAIRGRSARSSSGGTPRSRSGRASTSPTSRRRSRPTTSRPTAPRPRTRSPATTRSSCRRTAAAGSSSRRASRTGRCRRTTSRTSRRSTTRSTRSARTRAASSSSGRENPYNPVAGEPGAERLPVRRHHLPTDRAPHRGRDDALRAVPRPSCSRRCSARSARSSPRRRAGARRLGDDLHVARGDRGARARHRPDPADRRCRAARRTRSGCRTTGARAA